MTEERAISIAQKFASGGVCTLREGEAQEYHKRCLDALLSKLEKKNAPLTLDELLKMDGEDEK